MMITKNEQPGLGRTAHTKSRAAMTTRNVDGTRAYFERPNRASEVTLFSCLQSLTIIFHLDLLFLAFSLTSHDTDTSHFNFNVNISAGSPSRQGDRIALKPIASDFQLIAPTIVQALHSATSTQV